MVEDKTLGARLFDVFNITLMIALALVCILPFVHVTAVSFSETAPVVGNLVRFWPKDFTLENYKLAMENEKLWRAFGWSIARVVVGTSLHMFFCVLAAYPMSRPNRVFRAHNIIIGLFLFANLFDGGMLARFVVVRWVGLYDKFLGIVIPSMITTGSIILIMNYFRSLPQELEEAALIDGATHLDVLFRIFVPISTPIIATITLFTMVGLWNDWFQPMLYLRDASRYPLQTYLQAFINSVNIRNLFTQGELEQFLAIVSNRALRSATLIIATVPILLVYPFLQKYYVTGLKMGAVKE